MEPVIEYVVTYYNSEGFHKKVSVDSLPELVSLLQELYQAYYEKFIERPKSLSDIKIETKGIE